MFASGSPFCTTCLGGGCARGGGGGGRPKTEDPEGRQQSLRHGAVSSPGSRPAQQALQVRLMFSSVADPGSEFFPSQIRNIEPIPV